MTAAAACAAAGGGAVVVAQDVTPQPPTYAAVHPPDSSVNSTVATPTGPPEINRDLKPSASVISANNKRYVSH